MTPAEAIITLSCVNCSLRSALDHLCPDRTPSSTITAEDLSMLLAELVRAGGCLRGVKTQGPDGPVKTSGDQAALEREKFEYRNNLEKLKRALPDLHARLLAERARLQSAHKHFAAAAAWAHASGKTL